MPRNNQLALPSARSPVPQNMTGFNSYTGQLAVTVQDTNPNTQWPGDGEYMEAFKRKYNLKKTFRRHWVLGVRVNVIVKC